ncbi:MAG: hypothetical protein F6K65_00540 [Moorea sp. SIO3C2]|nr:hypothetical protein [Moorena sp. SIO3C2]
MINNSKHKTQKTYLVPAILVALFAFLPVGIFAVKYALEAENFNKAGNFYEAHNAAKKAKKLSIIGASIASIIYLVGITGWTYLSVNSYRQNLATLTKVNQGGILAKEGKIKEAISTYQEAQKLNYDIDLNPRTKEIDKDPKIVAHLLAAQAKVQEGAMLAEKGKIKEAISTYQEAQKLNYDIDLNPRTKEIDKDPRTVVQQLAPGSK